MSIPYASRFISAKIIGCRRIISSRLGVLSDSAQISLKNFSERIDEITKQICTAAENVGFFAIVDHGITHDDAETMFKTSESFFHLPNDVKATVPWSPK